MDIRGEGGQIIAAPSIHKSGRFYHWADGCAPWDGIADAPAWLEELAFNASKANAQDKPRTSGRTDSGRRNASAFGGVGFENLLALIGDGDDHEGFDTPIYRAACSWWRSNPDGDAAELIATLQEVILQAPCADYRSEDRYALDGYLVGRVDQARQFIKKANAENDLGDDRDKASLDDDPWAIACGILRQHVVRENGVVLLAADAAAIAIAVAKLTEGGISEEEAAHHVENAVADIERQLSAPLLRHPIIDEADLLTKETATEKGIRKLIRKALDDPQPLGLKVDLKSLICDGNHTRFAKRDFDRMWKEESEGRSQRNRENARAKKQESGEIPAINLGEGYDTRINYAQARIRDANTARQRLFQYGGAYATADAARGRVRLLERQNALYAELSKVTRWEAVNDATGGVRVVAPPEDVVRFMYDDPEFIDTLPEIVAVVTTPFFDRDGSLVDQPGYHAGAKVVLAPCDLFMDRVSDNPTKEEVADAVKLLLEEVIADFPLSGMTRAEIITAKGADAHAIAHTLAYVLLPFSREMIEGPTPGHAFTKPEAGTGATKLVDVLSCIAMGDPTPAMTFPTKSDEVGKTLTAVLQDGRPVTLFDNIGMDINSTELASAMTGTRYQARLLGKTQLVMVPVRTVWTFTANNIAMSKELLRRFILIPLDAKEPDPEKRLPIDGWRHADLLGWVRLNRGRLVHACLTIIKFWVAGGMVKQTVVTRGSFENWAGVMGGILAAAGVDGFLQGQDVEQAKARDVSQDAVKQLIDVFADYPDGTVFRAGGVAKFEKKPTISVMDILNGDDRPKIEPGDDASDPIQISHWGYNSFDGKYKTSGQIGRGMSQLARKPHRSGSVTLNFQELYDTKSKNNVYRMTKKDSGVDRAA